MPACRIVGKGQPKKLSKETPNIYRIDLRQVPNQVYLTYNHKMKLAKQKNEKSINS